MPTTDENLSLYLVHLLEVLHEKVTSAQFYSAGVVYKHRAAGLVSPFGHATFALLPFFQSATFSPVRSDVRYWRMPDACA